METSKRLARRDFLAATAAGVGCAAAASLRPPFAAALGDGRNLVLIELAGGNDGLNTVVPVGVDAYHRLRGRLAVPDATALPIGPFAGFHPALTRLARRFERGEVAVIEGVGAPGAGRSHEAAVAAARGLLAAPVPPRAQAAPGRDAGLPAALDAVADRIARGAPTRVHHVRLGGFDTHARQAHRHARLLARLDEALDGFLRRLERDGARGRTLVVCQSEFGRRPAPNKTGGTDHGTAGPVLAVGPVRGGLYGVPPDLEALDARGDLPIGVDVRRVHDTLLERWFDLPAAPTVRPLDFLA